MEGKGVRAVIMGLLILGLVVAQIEANSCCRDWRGRDCFRNCRRRGTRESVCARQCDCIIRNSCPPEYPAASISMLENSGDMISEYCKLGCASSVCDTITATNQNSGEGEVIEAVEHCLNACSELCNKDAKTALASA